MSWPASRLLAGKKEREENRNLEQAAICVQDLVQFRIVSVAGRLFIGFRRLLSLHIPEKKLLLS